MSAIGTRSAIGAAQRIQSLRVQWTHFLPYTVGFGQTVPTGTACISSKSTVQLKLIAKQINVVFFFCFSSPTRRGGGASARSRSCCSVKYVGKVKVVLFAALSVLWEAKTLTFSATKYQLRVEMKSLCPVLLLTQLEATCFQHSAALVNGLSVTSSGKTVRAQWSSVVNSFLPSL